MKMLRHIQEGVAVWAVKVSSAVLTDLGAGCPHFNKIQLPPIAPHAMPAMLPFFQNAQHCMLPQRNLSSCCCSSWNLSIVGLSACRSCPKCEIVLCLLYLFSRWTKAEHIWGIIFFPLYNSFKIGGRILYFFILLLFLALLKNKHGYFKTYPFVPNNSCLGSGASFPTGNTLDVPNYMICPGSFCVGHCGDRGSTWTESFSYKWLILMWNDTFYIIQRFIHCVCCKLAMSSWLLSHRPKLREWKFLMLMFCFFVVFLAIAQC